MQNLFNASKGWYGTLTCNLCGCWFFFFGGGGEGNTHFFKWTTNTSNFIPRTAWSVLRLRYDSRHIHDCLRWSSGYAHCRWPPHPQYTDGCTYAAEAWWLVWWSREDATASQARAQVPVSLPMSTGQQPGSSMALALSPSPGETTTGRTADTLRSSAILIHQSGPRRANRPTQKKYP